MFNNTDVIPKKIQIWFTIISIIAIVVIAVTINIFAAGALFVLNAINTMALAYVAQREPVAQSTCDCHPIMNESRMREYVDIMEKRLNDKIAANAKAIQDLIKPIVPLAAPWIPSGPNIPKKRYFKNKKKSKASS